MLFYKRSEIFLDFQKPYQMSIFRSGWYVIYTMPRHEKTVHNRLAEKKVDSFLPTRKALRIWHDRKKFVDEPLFPSYVFIYLKDMQSYYEGMEAKGSLYYVRAGKELARVNDSVVNNIKLAIDKADEIEVSDSPFQPGRRMVISQGPLCGLACEVVETWSKLKILVRVDLLQRNILLKVPEDYLLTMAK
jgi:transcriptional antiterminator RfaH